MGGKTRACGDELINFYDIFKTGQNGEKRSVTKNELLNAPTNDMKRSNFGMAAARQTDAVEKEEKLAQFKWEMESFLSSYQKLIWQDKIVM